MKEKSIKVFEVLIKAEAVVHGLPISKLYAQYFGGDIQILTFKGIGTDTIIYLNKLLDNQEKII